MVSTMLEISVRPGGGSLEYRRRTPESTVLYRVLQGHLETSLARIASDPCLPSWPEFVKRELRAYLSCGGAWRRRPRIWWIMCCRHRRCHQPALVERLVVTRSFLLRQELNSRRRSWFHRHGTDHARSRRNDHLTVRRPGYPGLAPETSTNPGHALRHRALRHFPSPHSTNAAQ